MEAVILAGGKGTRLASVVADRPKPMAEVLGRPFVDYLVGSLAKSGVVDGIVLSAGHLAHVIENHFQSASHSIPVQVITETAPLGTGGAILNSAQSLGYPDQILVMNGDSYLPVDWDSLIRSHLENSATITLVTTRVPDASRYGSVLLNGNRVIGFAEKSSVPQPGVINAGIYLIQTNALKAWGCEPCSFERDILPQLIQQGNVCAFEAPGPFLDIGVPEDYERAASFFLELNATRHLT